MTEEIKCLYKDTYLHLKEKTRDCKTCIHNNEGVFIDGVDVSGCCLYLKNNGKCLRFLTDGELDTECNAICDYGSLYRKEQLQRLEQENEKLKKELQKAMDNYTQLDLLRVKSEKLLTEDLKKVTELCKAEQKENASYKYNFHVCEFAKRILEILTTPEDDRLNMYSER